MMMVEKIIATLSHQTKRDAPQQGPLPNSPSLNSHHWTWPEAEVVDRCNAPTFPPQLQFPQ
jgi:hypothetical protein